MRREPPDWSQFDDRTLQETIADNAFAASRDAARALWWAQIAGGLAIVAFIASILR